MQVFGCNVHNEGRALLLRATLSIVRLGVLIDGLAKHMPLGAHLTVELDEQD